MPSRCHSKEKANPPKHTDQGECEPDLEQQQQPETDLSSDAPPTRRRVVNHPNRRWIVIDPDSSYIPRPGPGHDHTIRPWQVEAVVGAPADRVDEVITQVKDLKEPPSEDDFQAYSQQPISGSRQHCGTGSHSILPSNAQAGLNKTASQSSHGEFSESLGLLIDRESDISLDRFPSRSVGEGVVKGLCQCESGHASDGAAGAADSSYSPSSSCALDVSSGLDTDEKSFHTARRLTIRPARSDHAHGDEAAEHRMPFPAELNRMDGLIDDAMMLWEGVSPGPLAPIHASDEDEDEMPLTSSREYVNSRPDQDPATMGEGHLGFPSSPRPHITQGRPPPHADRTDEHPGVAQPAPPRPASPAPSDSSIGETVFDVRRLTPPPQRPDVAGLPSLQGYVVAVAAAAAAPSRGLRRGGAYSASDAGHEAGVPAVLIPGRRLGLGQGHSPPQASRRQGRHDTDGEGEKEEEEE